MIKLDEQLDKEIELYYKISVFVNKYILLMWSFILSILILFIFSSNSQKVLAYASVDINNHLKINLSSSNWFKTNVFNRKSKYIKWVAFLDKNTKVSKQGVYLWYGIFVGNGYYFPSNVSVKNSLYKKYILSKTPAWYIKFLSLSNKNDEKMLFKKPSLLTLKDDVVIKQYNLDCMDSFLSTSLFCDYNKKHLIQDLLQQRKDISSNMYNKLFSTFSIPKSEKCNMLVGIYFKKYNYKKIKDLLSNYCTDDIVNKVTLTDDVSNFLEINNLYANYKFKNSSAYLIQLINQEYDMIHSSVLQKENVLSYLSLLGNMLNNGNISRKDALNSYYFINKYISWKVDGLDDKINSVIDWDKNIGQKWLKSKIGKDLAKNISQKNDYHYVHGAGKIMSKLERFENIVDNNYKNDLLLLDRKYNNKENRIYIKANLVLSLKKSDKIIKKPVTIKFYVTELYTDSFNIAWLNFEDKKIKRYLRKLVKRNYDSLDDLEIDLERYLQAPLVYGDWKKNFSIDDIDICKKYKFKYKWWISCVDNKLIFTDSDINISPLKWLKIVFTLNNDLNVTKVDIDPISKEFILKEYFDEKININFVKYKKYINNKLKDPKNISYTKNLVKKVIKKAFNDTIKSKVGLSNENFTLLEKRYKKFLNSDIIMVRHYKWTYYIVYFRLNWKNFKSVYDFSKNIVRYVYIYNDKVKKFFLFRDVDLKLSSLNQTILNSFTSNPDAYLKAKYPNEYTKYIKETKNR